jgi:predicted RNA-binding Zn-ribbon protein involved in translation (DUF1610 family)
MELLGLEVTQAGKYVHFDCPECNKKAVSACYGEKKNLWICPECRAKGNIISLTMKLKGLPYEEAKTLLESKAVSLAVTKITDELNLILELYPHESIKDFSPEFCQDYGIGYCRKGIMAGHIAIPVHDENGMKVAYVGVNAKTGKLKFPKNFNPDFYLWNCHRAHPDIEVYFTTSLMDALKIIQDDKQAVSNFGLPYISSEQLKLIQDFKMVSLFLEIDYIRDISYQLATQTMFFHRFLK